MWLEQAHCSLFGSCQTSTMVSDTEFKVKASVVVMLHLCPVSDPVLFLGLLRLKSQVELIALSLAYFHSLVFWHYAVVDGSVEESKLEDKIDKEVIKEDTLNGIVNEGGRVRLRIQIQKNSRLGNGGICNNLINKDEKDWGVQTWYKEVSSATHSLKGKCKKC